MVLFATTVVVAAAAAVPGEAHGVAVGVQRPAVGKLTPHVLALPARAAELDDLVDEGGLVVLGSPLLASPSAAAAAAVGAALSAVINNVAALALLMSLDIEASEKAKRAASLG